ncbi:hypothetical protein CL673_04060 [Candidatus Bathyarchaeota archaeon]|jgi:hypothetical protein|nr:hypothetical protein [Candidatus Bathyarchaeota archaeon]
MRLLVHMSRGGGTLRRADQRQPPSESQEPEIRGYVEKVLKLLSMDKTPNVPVFYSMREILIRALHLYMIGGPRFLDF